MSEVTKQRLCNAFVPLSIMWSVNVICFMATLWGLGYCVHELDMEWMKIPRQVTLVTCGISKVIFTVLLMFSGLNRYNVKID